MPHALLTACILRFAVRAHLLHQQQLGLLHVADAVITSFFPSLLVSQVSKEFHPTDGPSLGCTAIEVLALRRLVRGEKTPHEPL